MQALDLPFARTLDRPRVSRLARVVVLGLLVGLAVGNLYWAFAGWSQTDAAAYWNAAWRLRDGLPLFPAGINPEGSDVYRYAPWLAWLAIPFTFLPVQVAGALWSLILVAASTAAMVPLVQRRAWALVLLFWPILIGISAVGNVQALMVAWLVWGVDRRSGPLWIALAASLKVVPLALVLVYLGRREWIRAAVTVLLTVLLVAPLLLYDLSHYPATAGQAGMLITWPVIYGLVVLVAAGVALRLASSRYGWLAASVAAVLALPRFFVYDVSLLMTALPVSRDRGAKTVAPGPS